MHPAIVPVRPSARRGYSGGLTSKRLLVAAPLLACVLAGTTGCDVFQGADAAPEPSAPATLEIAPTGTDRRVADRERLTEVDACELVSPGERQLYRITRVARVDLGRARACQFVAADQDFVLTVGVRERQGLDEFVDMYGDAVRTRVGGYPARRQQSTGGACLTGIGFTGSSRIDVDVSAGGGTSRACELTAEFADLVAARVAPG